MSSEEGPVGVDYLQFAARELERIKQRSYAFLHIREGDRVLDVGCGPGVDTTPLAQLVGKTGLVVGVDNDADMLADANRAAEQAGVSDWVVHECADARSMPFASNCFNSCRSERLFQYICDPRSVLGEMKRVTKMGGWVAVLDVDWGTMSIDTEEVDIERRLSRFRAEYFSCNGYSGRQLFRLFRENSFAHISLEVFPTWMTSLALAEQAFRLRLYPEIPGT